MEQTTFGSSDAAKYLADVLENSSVSDRRKASSSMAQFNHMMVGLRDIKDTSIHEHIVQMVPSEPSTSHPQLVFTLITNLRVARKRYEIKNK